MIAEKKFQDGFANLHRLTKDLNFEMALEDLKENIEHGLEDNFKANVEALLEKANHILEVWKETNVYLTEETYYLERGSTTLREYEAEIYLRLELDTPEHAQRVRSALSDLQQAVDEVSEYRANMAKAIEDARHATKILIEIKDTFNRKADEQKTG